MSVGKIAGWRCGTWRWRFLVLGNTLALRFGCAVPRASAHYDMKRFQTWVEKSIRRIIATMVSER